MVNIFVVVDAIGLETDFTLERNRKRAVKDYENGPLFLIPPLRNCLWKLSLDQTRMNHTVQMYFAKRRRIRGVLNLISEKELDNPIAFSIGTHRFSHYNVH